jgi:hypothetical protein
MQMVAQLDVAVGGSGQANKRSKGVAALALAGLMAAGVASGILVQQVGYYQEESSRAKMVEASNYTTAEDLLRTYAFSKGSFPCAASEPGGASNCEAQFTAEKPGWLPVQTLISAKSDGGVALENMHYYVANEITAASASLPKDATVLDVCKAHPRPDPKNPVEKVVYTLQSTVLGSEGKVSTKAFTAGASASSLGCNQLLKAEADARRQLSASDYVITSEVAYGKDYLSGQMMGLAVLRSSNETNTSIIVNSGTEMTVAHDATLAYAIGHGGGCPEEFKFVGDAALLVMPIITSAGSLISNSILHVVNGGMAIIGGILAHFGGQNGGNGGGGEPCECGTLPPGIVDIMMKTA